MRLRSSDDRVPGSTRADLGDWPTLLKPSYRSTKQYKSLRRGHIDPMRTLQQPLYASNRYPALLIF